MQKEKLNLGKELLIEKKELLKEKVEFSYLYLKMHKLYFDLLKDYCYLCEINPYLKRSLKQFDTFLAKYLTKYRHKVDQIIKLYEANGSQGEISPIIDQYLIQNEVLLPPEKFNQINFELGLSIALREDSGLENYCQLMEKWSNKKEENNYQPVKRK